MDHWLSNTGEDYQVDVGAMRSALPGFDELISSAVAAGAGGNHFDTGWRAADTGLNNLDYYYAIYNFQYRVTGGRDSGGGVHYWVQVFKRYNFGTPAEGGSDVFIGAKGVGVTVSQADLSRPNTLGKARDFNLVGTELFHR